LTLYRAIPYIWAMEVSFDPELQAQLDKLATDAGRRTDELVREVMTGYVQEVSQIRQMLDRRYDEIKSGTVNLIDGEEAFAQLRLKSEARRNSRA
jgi:predicted DNA-binding protein